MESCVLTRYEVTMGQWLIPHDMESCVLTRYEANRKLPRPKIFNLSPLAVKTAWFVLVRVGLATSGIFWYISFDTIDTVGPVSTNNLHLTWWISAFTYIPASWAADDTPILPCILLRFVFTSLLSGLALPGPRPTFSLFLSVCEFSFWGFTLYPFCLLSWTRPKFCLYPRPRP
jgi:hypothetical protein